MKIIIHIIYRYITDATKKYNNISTNVNNKFHTIILNLYKLVFPHAANVVTITDVHKYTFYTKIDFKY